MHCEHEDTITCITFSPDGKHLISGSKDETIQIWEVSTCNRLKTLTGHKDWVNSVTFSPNGQLLMSAAGDNSIRLWDLDAGVEVCKPIIGHTFGVMAAVFSKDGRRIFSGSNDGTCRIWQSDTSQVGYVEEIGQKLPLLPLDDGWIRSTAGELLLWIPPDYRKSVKDMCEVCVPADAPGHPVRLDWSKLVKGEEWWTILKEKSSLRKAISIRTTQAVSRPQAA